MTKPGYYIFLILDVIGYTHIRLYRNDKYLIPDTMKLYEEQGIDYKYFFCKSDFSLIRKSLKIVEKYGVSVLDMTGSFFNPGFHSCDEARILLIDMISCYYDRLDDDLKQLVLSEKPEYASV